MTQSDHAEWATYKHQRLQAIKEGSWEPTVPAAQVRDHIEYLMALGMSMRAIADKTGVSKDRISVIMGNQQKAVRKRIAEPLLALQLSEPYTEEGRITNLFALRRIQALQAMGWPMHTLAHKLGTHPEYLRGIGRDGKRTIPVELNETVKALYAELKDLEGPRNEPKLKARANEWPPPQAWREDELDDPEPTVIERVRGRWRQEGPQPHFGEILFDARESAGVTRQQIADELDVTLESVRRWEAGTLPWKKYRAKLARMLDVSEEWLFKDPATR